MKFTKFTSSKPWKYVYLTLWDLKKDVPDHFFTLQAPTRDPPESSPFPSRSPLGTQKSPPGRSGTPHGPPKAPFWPVFKILGFTHSNRTPNTETSIFISSGAIPGKSPLLKIDEFLSQTGHWNDLGAHSFPQRPPLTIPRQALEPKRPLKCFQKHAEGNGTKKKMKK